MTFVLITWLLTEAIEQNFLIEGDYVFLRFFVLCYVIEVRATYTETRENYTLRPSKNTWQTEPRRKKVG